MKKILLAIMIALVSVMPACRISADNAPNQSNPVQDVRNKLEELPEPTFNTIEVAVHDYSALGTKKLLERAPETKVPLKVLADSALSVLETEVVSMVDVVELSKSLDEIKQGNVKFYLSLGWTILELQGVIRRNDLTAQLTNREQRLLIAMFRGIRLGTDSPENVDRTLNSSGPRY